MGTMRVEKVPYFDVTENELRQELDIARSHWARPAASLPETVDG